MLQKYNTLPPALASNVHLIVHAQTLVQSPSSQFNIVQSRLPTLSDAVSEVGSNFLRASKHSGPEAFTAVKALHQETTPWLELVAIASFTPTTCDSVSLLQAAAEPVKRRQVPARRLLRPRRTTLLLP